MSKRQTAIFREAAPLPPFWTLRFEASQPPAPGHYMLADLGGPVREALFAAALTPDGFTVHLPMSHPARKMLPGTPVEMLGPLGRGFRLGEEHRLLLLADATELPPLLPLTTAAPETALVVWAPSRGLLPPPERFPPSLELYLVGTEAEEPPLSNLIRWAGRILIACRAERLPDLATRIRAERLHPLPDFAQTLVRAPMPCGVGACDICPVETRQGMRHVCTDGPVFDLLELI